MSLFTMNETCVNKGHEMWFSYAFALALAKAQQDTDPGHSRHYTTWISSRLGTKYRSW